MNFETIVWKLYDIANWIMRLIYLNLLWIFFSLLGLGIFGVFPSTAAMFSISRKWLFRETDIPLTKTFFSYFKKNFIQMNKIGIAMIIIGIILYVDLKFFQASEHIISSILSYVMIFALIIYFASILYLFPIYVHFKFKTFEYIKQSIIASLGKPLITIMMFSASYLLYRLFIFLPIVLMFFVGSLSSIVTMWIAMRIFPTSDYLIDEK